MSKIDQEKNSPCEEIVTHHGENIAKWRSMFGLTQAELAEKMKVTPSTVSRLEAEAKIDEDKLEKVSKALGINTQLLKSCNHEDTKTKIINYVNHISGGVFNQNHEVQFQNINPLEKISELYERIVVLSIEIQQLKDENKLLSQ